MVRKTIDGDNYNLNDQGVHGLKFSETMQKHRPKTVHTSANGNLAGRKEDAFSSESQIEDTMEEKTHSDVRKRDVEAKKDIVFRDAEDFKQLDRDLEIVKDREGSNDLTSEAEKVFITKTEKKYLEDIGNLASKMRTPLDDKHQKFFEKDRRKFVDRMVMPETREFDKTEPIPQDIVSKTMEIPVNIIKAELDGLRSYLLQLKELIAKREMAWARTTERDYRQRVEITRFKNEVNHLRMLCEKRQKDIKDRDQVISAKKDEIKELQKKIQSLKNAMLKLEMKEERTNDAMDGLTNEMLENSHLVHKSHMMKKEALFKTVGRTGQSSGKTQQHISTRRIIPVTRESTNANKQAKPLPDESGRGTLASAPSFDYDIDVRLSKGKSKTGNAEDHREESTKLDRRSSVEKVDEKLQRIEEMLYSDRRMWNHPGKLSKSSGEAYARMASEVDPALQKKFTLSNSKMRQEMLGAMTGLASNVSPNIKTTAFPSTKRNHGNPSALANTLLAARNIKIFNA